jgi:hypothetical protein
VAAIFDLEASLSNDTDSGVHQRPSSSHCAVNRNDVGLTVELSVCLIQYYHACYQSFRSDYPFCSTIIPHPCAFSFQQILQINSQSAL